MAGLGYTKIDALPGGTLTVNVSLGWQLRWRLRLMMWLIKIAALLMNWELKITDKETKQQG